MAQVAKAAGVSSALLHYHFDTKQRLLAAAASVLLEERLRRWATATASGGGIQALDRLWSVLEERSRDGSELAFAEFVAAAAHNSDFARRVSRAAAAERRHWKTWLPGMLRDIGAEPPLGSDELASLLQLLVDSLAGQLARGGDPAAGRATYDAFWLLIVSARQRGRT